MGDDDYTVNLKQCKKSRRKKATKNKRDNFHKSTKPKHGRKTAHIVGNKNVEEITYLACNTLLNTQTNILVCVCTFMHMEAKTAFSHNLLFV